jgi:hypothetical protein
MLQQPAQQPHNPHCVALEYVFPQLSTLHTRASSGVCGFMQYARSQQLKSADNKWMTCTVGEGARIHIGTEVVRGKEHLPTLPPHFGRPCIHPQGALPRSRPYASDANAPTLYRTPTTPRHPAPNLTDYAGAHVR